MDRRKFIGIAGTSILVAGGGYYLSSDKNNFTRTDFKIHTSQKIPFKPDEMEILFLASLAPAVIIPNPGL